MQPFSACAISAANSGNATRVADILMDDRLTREDLDVMFSVTCRMTNPPAAILAKYIGHKYMTLAMIMNGVFGAFIGAALPTPVTVQTVLEMISDKSASDIAFAGLICSLEKDCEAGVRLALPYIESDQLYALQVGAAYADYRHCNLYETVLSYTTDLAEEEHDADEECTCEDCAADALMKCMCYESDHISSTSGYGTASFSSMPDVSLVMD